MAEAIVHIGFNKCGSTAIQKWLADNIAALNQQGVGYKHTDPRADTICTNPQFNVLAHTKANETMPPVPVLSVLGIEVGDRATQDEAARKFEHEYREWLNQTDCSTYLISNEALGPWLRTPRLIAGLDLWTRHHIGPTRYVAYIRRPEPWTISLYGHEVRKGSTLNSLVEFASRINPVPYVASLQTWYRAIGPKRLEVRLFQEEWLAGKGLVEDFGKAIGADVSKLSNAAKLENLSYRDNMAGRYFNKWRAPKRPTLDAETRKTIENANATGMAWIQQTFFQGQEDRFRSWLSPETN